MVDMETNTEADTISSSDTVPLRRRIKRLKKRASALQRHLTDLKDEYIKARKIKEMAITGFASSHLCYGPLEVGEQKKSLSLEKQSLTLRQLDQDYNTLTSAVGVLTLMRQDERFEFAEPFTKKLTKARSLVDRVICELFLVMKKLQDRLPAELTESLDLHVSDNGYYRPVVKAWCSVSTRFCRHERNAALLNQLVDFSRVLRKSIREISI